ncbi:MAG: hypothetical protein AMXMBFR53_37520 [Gemmatimonadota bacterium]
MDSTVGGAGAAARRTLDLAGSAPWFVGLLALALVAFWPSYLSRLPTNGAYTHVHAVLATLWILLLIVQPALIRRHRRDVHRALGRASYALAPLVVISIVLLAHSRIAGLSPEAFARQSYVLYLQASLAVLYTVSYALAVRYRGDRAVHARFMVCTGFTLIDPVVIRLLGVMGLSVTWNRQWITFGLTDAVILALIVAERGSRRGRWVLAVMLPVFVASQLPALLGTTSGEAWQAFARWFAGLPLT